MNILKLTKLSSSSKVGYKFWQQLLQQLWQQLSLKIGSKVRQKFWQQLCYQVAAVSAAFVAAWLLGRTSMPYKFNSDNFTFLKFETLPSGSKVRQLFWQQLCYEVAADAAALLPGNSSMHWKFNSDNFIFLSF